MSVGLLEKDKYVVELKNINLRYETESGEVLALENINLDIKEGEFICVLGPSGCGKSTLLKIIAGFNKPSDGEARMDNKIINGAGYERGVVFQAPTLYPWLNIYDNVAFGLKMRNIDKIKIDELVKKYLDIVGLKDFQKKKPYELSGGMKQRASLARVLVNTPRMILMDEPFGALDAFTRQNMQSLIRKIWIKNKSTIFLITHDVDEALALGTRVLIMSSRPGKMLKEFNVDFTYHMSEENNSKSLYSNEYINIREEILNIINCQK